MDVDGVDVPPPCKRFVDMKLPKPVLDKLAEKGITRPTPIQMQGLTVALAGRDLIGIAFTGSGKTLTFGLPMVVAALEEELRMPLVGGEGPIGIVLAPSRELAKQTHEVVSEFCDAATEHFRGLRRDGTVRPGEGAAHLALEDRRREVPGEGRDVHGGSFRFVSFRFVFHPTLGFNV